MQKKKGGRGHDDGATIRAEEAARGGRKERGRECVREEGHLLGLGLNEHCLGGTRAATYGEKLEEIGWK